MAAIRTVTYNVDFPTGAGWPRRIVFRLRPGSYDATALYPAADIVGQVDANGEGSVQLWANSGGLEPCVYECQLPSGETFEFNVPDGSGTLTLQALRAAGV